jgi:hypothetical protein
MTFDRIEHSMLQIRLIKSLETIAESPQELREQYQRLLKVIAALKAVSIPERDLQQVYNFTFMLTAHIPELLQHSKNEMLHKLSSDCFKLLEQSAKTQPKRKSDRY